MRQTSWAWGVVAVLVAGAMQASASMPYPLETEDDLAVVKRAVAASAQVSEPSPRAKRVEAAPAEARKKSDKPQWLRVRVVEKGSKKGKVAINVPLSLVRALGDDLPLDFDCDDRDREGEGRGEGHRKACTIKIGDILQALDAGQDLVEVDDDEATVRIWVE